MVLEFGEWEPVGASGSHTSHGQVPEICSARHQPHCHWMMSILDSDGASDGAADVAFYWRLVFLAYLTTAAEKTQADRSVHSCSRLLCAVSALPIH